MLVLSRREAEKILFPSLGITIEVARVYRRTVSLGIDAPKEIRIIRSELEDYSGMEINKPLLRSNRQNKRSWDAPTDLQKCLDAANLAIHLAQNQLRQQLTAQAEQALENALECLANLELAAGCTDLAPVREQVRESKTGYRSSKQKIALVVNDNDQLGDQLQSRLSSLGYSTLQLDSGEALINFLQRNDQPNMVLTLHPPMVENSPFADSFLTENAENDVLFETQEPISRNPPCEFTGFEAISRTGLRMFGVGSLQKSSQTFSIGDCSVVGWFAEPTDAAAIANCFG